MINEIIANVIWVVHLFVIIFVICVPIVDSPYLLLLHTIFIPFLMLHWVTNNNTCVLTTTEKYLRNVKTKEEEEDCYTCKLVNPIFDFKKNHVDASTLIYAVTFGAWLVSVVRLFFKYKHGQIKKVADLFLIKKPSFTFPPI